MTPNLGQGACLALEDAVELAAWSALPQESMTGFASTTRGGVLARNAWPPRPPVPPVPPGSSSPKAGSR